MAADRPDVVDLNFEENIAIGRSNRQDAKFDMIIGHLEDIIMEDDFQEMESNFMEKYYMEFENNEENKLIYTDIFNEYISTIEKYIEESLRARIPNFSMKEFMKMLQPRQDQIGGDILDILTSFTDFLTFKEKFLDYKASKEGTVPDLSIGPSISSLTINRNLPCISPDFTTCKQNSAAVPMPSTAFPTVVAPNLPISHSPLGVTGFTTQTIQAMNVDQQSISTSDLMSADGSEHATSSSNFVTGNPNPTDVHEERCDDSEELLDPPESMEYSQ